MMEEKKSVLIFCEGPHDVALVSLILKKLLNASEFSDKFSALPSPFDKLFQTAIENHAKLELSLDMAHKFFLPDLILTKGDTYIVLFNAGGQNRGDKIKPFIQNLWDLTLVSDTFPGDATTYIKEHKYIFVSDADFKNHDATLADISSAFETVGGQSWINTSWNKINGTYIAINDKQKNVAALVWCNTTSGLGTLEDVLMECLDKDVAYQQAQGITIEMHDWQMEHPNPQRRIAEIAKMRKASITLMGQKIKPGGSMNVIVSQSKLINSGNLQTSPTVNNLVKFFLYFLN